MFLYPLIWCELVKGWQKLQQGLFHGYDGFKVGREHGRRRGSRVRLKRRR
jgi:hypothetical protein